MVSEGRCTRGANLQIFKVDEEESNYKYILLIDTEGLASAANETFHKIHIVETINWHLLL